MKVNSWTKNQGIFVPGKGKIESFQVVMVCTDPSVVGNG
jgi:hypothetical protein